MTPSIYASTFNSRNPYRGAVTELLQLLEDAEILTPENKPQAIAIAIDYLDDNSDFISIQWCADDVLSIADEKNLNLSHDQCLEVLDYLEDNHDANYGLSWNSIHCALDHLDFS